MPDLKPDLPPRDVIGLAAEICGCDPQWKPLSGGRTNHIWRCVGSDQDLVFKLFKTERANPLFPNDAEAERRALIALEVTGLAPAFAHLENLTRGRCLVYKYTRGLRQDRAMPNTLSTLGWLHQLDPPKGLRHIELSPFGLMEQGTAFLKGIDTKFANQVWAQKPTAVSISLGPKVFLHGDPVPANVITTGGEVTFIDWQCPAIGDASYDLAMALSPAMHVIYGQGRYTDTECEVALAAYPDASVRDRYRAMRPYYHWHMAAYCAWKSATGEPEYEPAGRAELMVLSEVSSKA